MEIFSPAVSPNGQKEKERDNSVSQLGTGLSTNQLESFFHLPKLYFVYTDISNTLSFILKTHKLGTEGILLNLTNI